MQKTKKNLLVYGFIFFFFCNCIFSAAVPGYAAEEPSNLSKIFSDVAANDPNAPFISYLRERGLIKGFPDGSFHPAEGLTRAEAATIMVLAGRVKADPALPSPFNDVQDDHWAKATIASAVKAGYISGFPDKTFHPEEKLTRAQAMTMVLRLSKQPLTGAELPQLNDITRSHWAAPSVAIGIASGMLGLSSDAKQFLPEQAITRAEMARALGVLLTNDPDLNQAALLGKIQVKSGTVSIQQGTQESKPVNGSAILSAGDTICTDKGAEAEITYGDGSGLLLKGDTQLLVKEARGRAYIKSDGRSAIAVDWLLLDLKKGKMFGALATSSQVQEQNEATDPKTTGYLNSGKRLIASLNPREFIGAAPKASTKPKPWYESAKTKKVKVEVDMPWGVAAIRGTFWNNIVLSNGSGSTSILQGAGEVTAGGQTVSLAAGQQTQGQDGNTPPAPPQTMTPSQMVVWTQVASWAEQRAEVIQQSQEANPPAPPIDQQTPAPTAPVLENSLVSQINSAITAAQTAVDSIPSPPSNSSGGGNPNPPPVVTMTPYTPLGSSLGDYTLNDQVSLTLNDVPTVLTQEFCLSPSAALTAQGATHYELWAKVDEDNYVQIGQRTPITDSIRHLKKVFMQPDKLSITFHNNDNYLPIAVASLGEGKSLSNLYNRTISGTISLPVGKIAPAGGLQLTLDTYCPVDGVGGYGQIEQDITIAAGSNAATYTLAVPANPDPENGYHIGCSISGDYSEPYIVSLDPSSTGVNVHDMSKTGVDLAIVFGKVISGTIALPEVAHNNVGIRIRATADGENNYSTDITIPSGAISATYSLRVPAGANYKVQYYIYNINNAELETFLGSHKYFRWGNYSTTGTSISTAAATLLDASTQDLNNIDMNVITGNTISGTIHLPQGITAPDRGLWVNISASVINGYGNFNSYVVIPEGQNSVDYTMVVAPASYSISYYVQGSNGSNPVTLNPINATTNIGGVNPEVVLPGGSNTPIPTPLSPVEAADNTILVGNVYFNLESSGFYEAAVLKALGISGTDLYFKYGGDTTKWYDLTHAAGIDLLGNPVSDSTLPQILYDGSTLIASTNAVVTTEGIPPFHLMGETLTMQVEDADMNKNGLIKETVNVQVRSSSTDLDGVSVCLTETGDDTGVFSGQVKIDLTSNAALTPPSIGAMVGEDIIVYYSDDANEVGISPIGRETYVTVVTGIASLSPASLTQGYLSQEITVNAPNANFDGTTVLKIVDKYKMDVKLYPQPYQSVDYTLHVIDAANATVTVGPGLQAAAYGPYRVALYKQGVYLYAGWLVVEP